MHIAGGIILIPKIDDVTIKENIFKNENMQQNKTKQNNIKQHLADLLMSC